jgi:hypothetical protein
MSTDDPIELRRNAAVRLAEGAYHWLERRLEVARVDEGLANLADNLALLLGEHDLELTFGGDDFKPWVLIHAAGDIDDVRAGFPTQPGTPECVEPVLEAACLRLGYEV